MYVWNRVPDEVRRKVVKPTLKAHNLIINPAFIVIEAAREFEDKTNSLDLALEASGCDQVRVVHKPRLISDNGSSCVSGDLAECAADETAG